MKQSIIIKAYKALSKLSQQELPIRLAYDLFKVKQALQPQWDFQLAEEGKIIAGAKTMPNGNLSFDTQEDAEKCQERLQELGEIDVDLDVPKVMFPLSMQGIKLSIEDIDALSAFVEFATNK